jgi:hypothetical protein
MSEKLKPYKTIWVLFISDSKSGLKFLGEKEYPYHVTKLCFEEMIKLSGSGNYLCFTIKNGSGYDYHGAEVVWMNYTEPVIDSQVSTLTEVIHTGRLETIKEEFDSFGNPHILRQSVKIIHLKSKKLIYSSDMEDSCLELTEPDELTITTNRDAKDVIDRLKCTFDDLGAEAKKASKCLSNMAVSINDYSNEPMYSNTSEYECLKAWDNLRTSKSIYALDTASEPDFCSISWLKENPYLTLKGDNNEIMINEKENKTMFENVFKGFEFGVATSVRTSIYGPAFHCGNTFVSYDKATGTYIDVTDLLFDIENMNYRMPIAANAVSVGDYIIHQHKWVRVLECLDAGRLQVEDIQERQVITILPVKNVFGFDFYTKLFCFSENFLSGAATADSPFGNLLPLMLMSKGNGKDNLLPLMMMSSGFGNGTQMNPLMMYALMGNKGGSDNTLLMMMALNGGNGFNFNLPTTCNCGCHNKIEGEDE